MSLQNKVDPAGEIHKCTMRGQLFGNRGGRFHDPYSRELLPRRPWVSRQWICCLTEFKNRQRTVMSAGYTELFFLDEVTAFSAGHRPCFECRRAAAKKFAACWAEARQLDRPPKAGEMDMVLHQQRLNGRSKQTVQVEACSLPDGAMIQINDHYYARHTEQWVQWSWHGYGKAAKNTPALVQLLTPPAIIDVLRAGYKPQWHKDS